MNIRTILIGFKDFVFLHKKISIITIIGIVALSVFLGINLSSNKEGVVQTKTAKVELGEIEITISGTGQVVSEGSVDLKSEVEGSVYAVKVSKGDVVEEGQLLAILDTTETQEDLDEAQLDYDLAELEYEDFIDPADEYEITQAENTLKSAQNSLAMLKINQEEEYETAQYQYTKNEEALEKSYEDILTSVFSIFSSLPTTMDSLDDIIYGTGISDSEVTMNEVANIAALEGGILVKDRDVFDEYMENVETDFELAEELYSETFSEYGGISRYSDKEDIEELLDNSIDMIRQISQAVKSTRSMFDYWVDYRNELEKGIYDPISEYQTSLSSYSSTTSSNLSSLLSSRTSLETSKKTLTDSAHDIEKMDIEHPFNIEQAEWTVQEKQKDLDDLLAGPTESEILSQQMELRKKELALEQAQQALYDCYVTAPFSGTVSDVYVEVGDNASSGTEIASLISEDNLAEITLNEIDIGKVEIGQKALITFDALDDLTVEGEVVSVDIVGSTSQGVVTYDVEIAFEKNDSIKPSMNVEVEIIIQQKEDILVVSSDAIKTMQDKSFVTVVENGAETDREVEVGITNDILTEIVSGLVEGEEIIVTSNFSTGSSGSSSQSNDFGPPSNMDSGNMMMMMQ